MDEGYRQQVTMWLGRKNACPLHRLAIWPVGTSCHDLKTWTHSHHNIYKYILCVHAVDRARL